MNTSGFSRPDWGIPVVYTRAQNGQLFDAAGEAAAPAAQAPALPRPEQQQQIDAGLHALRDIVQTTDNAREAVVTFRTDFQASSEQIETLGTYKDIHDQLHSLQVHCFNLMVLETRRTTPDDVSWDSLSNYELTLQGIVERLRDIAGRSAQLA